MSTTEARNALADLTLAASSGGGDRASMHGYASKVFSALGRLDELESVGPRAFSAFIYVGPHGTWTVIPTLGPDGDTTIETIAKTAARAAIDEFLDRPIRPTATDRAK